MPVVKDKASNMQLLHLGKGVHALPSLCAAMRSSRSAAAACHPQQPAPCACPVPIADKMECLVSVPPFGILEPKPTYDDGTHREDGTRACQTLPPHNGALLSVFTCMCVCMQGAFCARCVRLHAFTSM